MNFTRLYTIRTEWTEEYQRNAERLMSSWFDSFNIVRGTGYWNLVREDSMTIEVIANDRQRDTVYHVARAIRKANKQEAIFVTASDITGELLS